MKQAVQVTEELNLRGEVCPYTFVKSKLALEEMESGRSFGSWWTTRARLKTSRGA